MESSWWQLSLELGAPQHTQQKLGDSPVPAIVGRLKPGWAGAVTGPTRRRAMSQRQPRVAASAASGVLSAVGCIRSLVSPLARERLCGAGVAV